MSELFFLLLFLLFGFLGGRVRRLNDNEAVL